MNLIRLNIHLFLLAVPLNLVWEVAQISAYDFPGSRLVTNVIGCFIPSLGDGLMTLIIYWNGWVVFQNPKWILSPGSKGYLLMVGVGLTLALLVEWNALYRTRAWAYNERMITIPILGVGLLPILQMVLLPSATAFLLQWIWRNRVERSNNPTKEAKAKAIIKKEGGETMALQKGERYRCPDSECGCEIEVIKGASPGKGGNLAPRCCCGKEMQQVK